MSEFEKQIINGGITKEPEEQTYVLSFTVTMGLELKATSDIEARDIGTQLIHSCLRNNEEIFDYDITCDDWKEKR